MTRRRLLLGLGISSLLAAFSCAENHDATLEPEKRELLPFAAVCSAANDCASSLCAATGGAEGRCSHACNDATECEARWECALTPDGATRACVCAPSGPDTCDGRDNDCNGLVDDGPAPDESCRAARGPGFVCREGSCTCAVECNGTCTDTQSDVLNCGGCGVACDSGAQCVGGKCACGPELTQCGAACSSLLDDPDHCGSCEKKCGQGEQCFDGVCSCDPPRAQCGAACVDLEADLQNCGSCGNVCTGDGATCSDGVCRNITIVSEITAGSYSILAGSASLSAPIKEWRSFGTPTQWYWQLSPFSPAYNEPMDTILRSFPPSNIASPAIPAAKTAWLASTIDGGEIFTVEDVGRQLGGAAWKRYIAAYSTADGTRRVVTEINRAINCVVLQVLGDAVYCGTRNEYDEDWATGGALYSVPRAGGTLTTLAAAESGMGFPSDWGAVSLATHGGNIYWFANGWVYSVPAGGGPLSWLEATSVTRDPGTQISIEGDVLSFAGASLGYVDLTTSTPTVVPRTWTNVRKPLRSRTPYPQAIGAAVAGTTAWVEAQAPNGDDELLRVDLATGKKVRLMRVAHPYFFDQVYVSGDVVYTVVSRTSYYENFTVRLYKISPK